MSICFKCLKEIGESVKYGLHESCFEEWFGVGPAEEFMNLELRSDSTPKSKKEQKNKGWNSSFFHGNYKKYSASLGDDSYILKVKEAQYPELPEVEYISNQIAKSLKIPVPEFFLISLFGERVFVTKNFCRTAKSRMTLDHIYKYLTEDCEFDCETLIEVLFKNTKKYVDVEIFIRTCLFDSVIGNHDRHGRNLGLIVTARGVRLSPIYDNPSELGLESGNFLKMHRSPKGKIYTKNSAEPTPKDYVEQFVRLGYEDVVTEFIDVINKQKIFEIIDEGFCTDLMKDALKRLIEERINEIQKYDPRSS